MNYSNLCMQRIKGSVRNENGEEMMSAFSPILSDFLVENIHTMLECKYDIEGTVDILPNLMRSKTAQNALIHVLAFFIIDSKNGYYTDRQGLDAYEIRYTLEGSGVLEYKGKKYTLKKGEGFFISNKERHVYYAGAQGWKSTVLHVNGGLVRNYLDEFEAKGGVGFTVDEVPSFEMLQMQALNATQKIVPYMEYKVSCLLNILLTELLTSGNRKQGNNPGADTELVGDVCSYLRDHLEEQINFDRIAADKGVSRSVFFRQFKVHTGFTPGDYLLQLRMNQAKILLKTTNLSIEEISARAGYNDAGHFGQIFKKYEGIPPLKYRKK